MRRTAAVVGVVATMVLATAGVAVAESQTVPGTVDIDQMVANNAQTEVRVRVDGMAAPCDTHFLHVAVNWRGPDLYRAEAGCYPGGVWAKSLVYHETADLQNGTIVNCPGLVFRWNGINEFFKVVVPRSCLDQAPNRVRVSAEGHVYTSTQSSEAGPTGFLARG